jgi:hypothetical protein
MADEHMANWSERTRSASTVFGLSLWNQLLAAAESSMV